MDSWRREERREKREQRKERLYESLNAKEIWADSGLGPNDSAHK